MEAIAISLEPITTRYITGAGTLPLARSALKTNARRGPDRLGGLPGHLHLGPFPQRGHLEERRFRSSGEEVPEAAAAGRWGGGSEIECSTIPVAPARSGPMVPVTGH